MRNDVPSQVMNKIIENGYEEQLIDTMMECESMSDKCVSDIPLSPTLIQDSGMDIVITEQVYEQYKELIRKSNSGLPVEIPFILLGKKKDIDGKNKVVFEKLLYGFTDESQLRDNSVSLEQSIFDDCTNGGYEIISIGHTHPNVSDERKKETLANNLSSELKEKYQIRDVGLNISVADIWQQEYWKDRAKGNGFNGQILQTVIMYNGDIIVISDDSISKSNNILARTNNTLESVPTATAEQFIRKGKKEKL